MTIVSLNDNEFQNFYYLAFSPLFYGTVVFYNAKLRGNGERLTGKIGRERTKQDKESQCMYAVE